MNYQKVIARTIVAVVAFISTGIALVTLILALRAIEPLGFYAKCVCGFLCGFCCIGGLLLMVAGITSIMIMLTDEN